jgi:hypothetical protein
MMIFRLCGFGYKMTRLRIIIVMIFQTVEHDLKCGCVLFNLIDLHSCSFDRILRYSSFAFRLPPDKGSVCIKLFYFLQASLLLILSLVPVSHLHKN